MNTAPKAFIFDVFGTLVDWRSSVARQMTPELDARNIQTDPHEFADLWRGQYDPAMAPIRAGKRPYQPLDLLHYENLKTVLTTLGHADRFTDSECRNLAHVWERLDPWPDVSAGLVALSQIAPIAPCSNGSVPLMTALADHAGFHWDHILGASVAENYKPHPSVYLKSCEAMGLQPSEVMMVAAHNSDLAAAAECGLQTGFFPRPTEHGKTQTTDLAATGEWDVVANDLADFTHKIFP